MSAEAVPATLRGHTAIVTGAGRGLRRAYALDLARRGAATVVNDLDADVADKVVKEIQAVGGTAACVASVATPDGGRPSWRPRCASSARCTSWSTTVGVSAGWYPPDLDAVTAETVAAHIGDIRALGEYSVPGNIFDEIISAIDGIPDASDPR
jgi:NAD(P)-dependent dehydrogenase (short-subunit alcohol dehydrogenase family)